MKTGIMLMSDRGPDGQPMDWRKALENWKSHGLEAVDVFDRMLQSVGETVGGIKKLLGDLGLEPSIYCVPTDLVSPDSKERKTSLDSIRRGVDACAELGITQLFSHGGQHNNEGEEALLRYADGLGKAADIAAEAGLTFSIENAGRMCHTHTELKRCVDLVGRPNMRITFDGGNFILAGCDSHEAAELLAPQVTHVHVKSFISDPEGAPRPFRYCPTGEGLVDYRVIRDTFRAVGFDGCMSFEPEGGFDSQWEHSIDVLSEIVNETR
ncbi:MAG: sugar phosphate isomerase/epimerase [Lentisphaeria bacterium]|nr:sugar phosphate isomerase/epimerase [Lentisphaeria bacterium]